MALLLSLFFVFSFSSDAQAISGNQSKFFSLIQQTVKGSLMAEWEFSGGKPFCNFTGVTCDEKGSVIGVDLSGRALSGSFPGDVCSYLPALRVLRLARSGLRGGFPHGITNCSALEELDMSYLFLTGRLPDFSPMTALRRLDLSYNYFSGDFPASVFSLPNVEKLNFNEDNFFNLWRWPENVTGMTKVKFLVLTTCMLEGEISATIGNMTELIDLELSGNSLTGKIPKEIGLLKNLKQLELYYNQLQGDIPEELGNLTELVDLDMSVNKLTGKLPESICRLPKLEVLQLYNNSLTGEIPRAISNSTSLTMLSLYDNYMTGEVPRNLGQLSSMLLLDLSENRFSGNLPEDVCRAGKLVYFLMLENKFTGGIPESYGKCSSLLRFRVSWNRLNGALPEGLFGLPHTSIIDVGNNNLSGEIPSSVVSARNLSQLFLQSNRISGVIPPEISGAVNLVKIDISNNLLSGPIPPEIGNLKRLNLLLLQGNQLNSSIPRSLSQLKSLNVLDLSDNHLTGNIPESLSELLPNSLNFTGNDLSGQIPIGLLQGGLAESFSGNPGLCVSVHLDSSDQKFPLCSQTYNRKRLDSIWAIGISAFIIFIGGTLYLKRRLNREKAETEHEDAISSSFFAYDVKSFHRITFDPREIMASMVEKNIVGHGGSGTVYKIRLGSGEMVAVKRLWSRRSKEGSGGSDQEQVFLDSELRTEVETLGSIRHKNIVKLYCYFSSLDCSLLVYEFMPNGNLWDALHSGRVQLDWPIRHQIALGTAQGLAYLHHDLLPSIVHRDIKTTNILLDVNYQPRVADFGIAKVLQARAGKDSTTTVVAGTYGYIAPEYAYSSKATAKGDVYSFGIVLMELITGKKPVESEFGDNKNIIYWVSNKVDSKNGAVEVLDATISTAFRDQMIQVLRIAVRCTFKNPALRPTMKEVVKLLIEADPCRFHSPNSFKTSPTK